MSAWSERELEETVDLPPDVPLELVRQLEQAFVGAFRAPNFETHVLAEVQEAHGTHRANSSFNVDDVEVVQPVEHIRLEMEVRGTRAVISTWRDAVPDSNWMYIAGMNGVLVSGVAAEARRLVEAWVVEHPSKAAASKSPWLVRLVAGVNHPWVLAVGGTVMSAVILKALGLV